jgi:hypothetical protein
MRRAGFPADRTLNGDLPGCPGVRGRFVRTIDDWRVVDGYPVGSENDRIAWFLITAALSKFLGLRVKPGLRV